MSAVEWAIETLEGVMATTEGGIYNVISRETVEALLADKGALELLAKHGYEITPFMNDAGEVIGNVIRTAASSNGATTAVSNTVEVLVKETAVDQALIDAVASGSVGTAADVGTLTVGETVSEVTLTGGGAGVGGTALATVAGPAIAVGLGVALGTIMYNIAPDFWSDVSDKLVQAGKTIGGKVLSFFDKDGNTFYDDETINIIREALIKRGYLSEGKVIEGELSSSDFNWLSSPQKNFYNGLTKPAKGNSTLLMDTGWGATENSTAYMEVTYKTSDVLMFTMTEPNVWDRPVMGAVSKGAFAVAGHTGDSGDTFSYYVDRGNATIETKPVYAYANFVRWEQVQGKSNVSNNEFSSPPAPAINSATNAKHAAYVLGLMLLYGGTSSTTPAVKPKPTEAEGARTVPTGIPTDKTGGNKKVYPYPFPAGLPNPNDNDNPAFIPSDNFDPDPTPNDDGRSNPKTDPNDKPKEEPEDVPAPNPNPNQPDKDPTDDKLENPKDPNPNKPDGGNTSDPPFPIVPSAGLGNIYNPSRGQVEALQSYLWSADNLVDIMKLFQNPVDGIISLHWVFGTPSTGGSKEITLGYLPTGVSAPIVVNQFADIDCGTISIPLKQKNALDYPPYTDVQIYLPFIGIQPLNAYDLVGGSLNVTYRIDVYTGACVAKLTVKRGGLTAKMYEFAGNCGYELPLTSGNFIGMVGNVVSGAVMGAVSGGVAGAALGAAGSVIHSNLNISRSGNLSANAGICGSRNPYVIITRAVPYDAANYNQFYGYPSNKTVYLSNCKGFTKVKEIILHTSATQAEKEEIEALLKGGVYI